MTPFRFAGHQFVLDPLGALVWPGGHTLVVSDLHLEKGTACALNGRLVPPWDTSVTLDRLALLMRRHRPRTVVALGDSFHDGGGLGRMAPADSVRLTEMTAAAAFVWVLGNHDPLPPALPGRAASVWAHEGLTFRHEAQRGAAGEVCGHHHPKATIETRASPITRPCFMMDDRRIMLPALGAYAGGLDVRHPAIARLFPRGGQVALLGRDRLFSFALAVDEPSGSA